MITFSPKTLDEIVAQDESIQIIKNHLENNTDTFIPLFLFGPKGVGKTSTALAIIEEYEFIPNIIRGETQGKVEYIKEVISELQYRPPQEKNLYLIDEFHNLSKAAMEALLDILENPPKKVLFILTTTEPNKVIDTIKDRCLQLIYKSIPEKEIASFIEKLAKRDKLEHLIVSSYFKKIPKKSEGSIRSAIKLLNILNENNNLEFEETDSQELAENVLNLISKRINIKTCLSNLISNRSKISANFDEIIVIVEEKLLIERLKNGKKFNTEILDILYKYYANPIKSSNTFLHMVMDLDQC